MKTFFGRLLFHFDFIAHPASGWLSNKDGQRKRKEKREGSALVLSPDSVNMRSPATKKQNSLRRTPAP